MIRRNRKFAYGMNETNGVKCPSFTAFPETDSSGVTPKQLYGPVVQYDRILYKPNSNTKHVVSEKVAKAAWFAAIQKIIEEPRYPADYKVQLLGEGLQVAEKLGWLK